MLVSTCLARLSLNCVCVGYVKPYAGVHPLPKLIGTQEVCTHPSGAAGQGAGVQTMGCRLYLQLQKASVDVSEVIQNECEPFGDALGNMSMVYTSLWPFLSTLSKTF